MKTLLPNGEYRITGPEQGLVWAIGGSQGLQGRAIRHLHGETVAPKPVADVGWNDGKPIFYCEYCRGYIHIAYLYA